MDDTLIVHSYFSLVLFLQLLVGSPAHHLTLIIINDSYLSYWFVNKGNTSLLFYSAIDWNIGSCHIIYRLKCDNVGGPFFFILGENKMPVYLVGVCVSVLSLLCRFSNVSRHEERDINANNPSLSHFVQQFGHYITNSYILHLTD